MINKQINTKLSPLLNSLLQCFCAFPRVWTSLGIRNLSGNSSFLAPFLHDTVKKNMRPNSQGRASLFPDVYCV